MGWVLNQLICSACVAVLGRLADCLVPWLARLLLDSTPHTSYCFMLAGQYLLQYLFASLYLAMTALYAPCLETSIDPKAVLVLVCLSLHRACGSYLHGTICMPAELEIN